MLSLCIHVIQGHYDSAGHIWLLQTSNGQGNFPFSASPLSQDWINQEGEEEDLLTSLVLSMIYGKKSQLAFKTTIILPSKLLSLFPFSLLNIAYIKYPKSFQLLLLSFLLGESWLKIHSCCFGFRSWRGVCEKTHASHLETFSFRICCRSCLKIWTWILHSAPLNTTAAICQMGGIMQGLLLLVARPTLPSLGLTLLKGLAWLPVFIPLF